MSEPTSAEFLRLLTIADELAEARGTGETRMEGFVWATLYDGRRFFFAPRHIEAVFPTNSGGSQVSVPCVAEDGSHYLVKESPEEIARLIETCRSGLHGDKGCCNGPSL